GCGRSTTTSPRRRGWRRPTSSPCSAGTTPATTTGRSPTTPPWAAGPRTSTPAVQYEAIGGGASKTAKLIVAGCVGLLAVGLVLLVVALAARSRSGAAPLG